MTVARCSTDWPGPVRSRTQRLSSSSVSRWRSWLRIPSGALTTSAWRWVIARVRLSTAPLTRREQDPDRLSIATLARLGEVLPTHRLAGCPHGVELVGLGAVAAGRSRWPIDLDDPLALLEQEGREP
jgi:hypothetical protein